MNLLSPMPLAEVNEFILTPALEFLGSKYDSKKARLFLLTAGQQESLFQYRRQKNDGPAMGFWQFERGGGVKGVMAFHSTRETARGACDHFGVEFTPMAVWQALQTNDLLAACFARLLVYTDPKPLPAIGDSASYWDLYMDVWRPGKPHPETWQGFFNNATAFLATVE